MRLRPPRSAARRFAGVALVGITLGATAVPAVAADPTFRALTAPLPGELAAIDSTPQGHCAPGSPPAATMLAVLRDGRRLRISLERSDIRLSPSLPCAAAPRTLPPNLLPDTLPQPGTGAIAETWLSTPTLRYRHDIFLRPENAAALTARLADGRAVRYAAPANAVIEDRRPRIIRYGDAEAILTVQSYANAGAAVLLLAPVGDALQVLAESVPIGRPGRWLNPIAAADFDGDGAPEVAAVVTPHIGGVLTLYRRAGARLVVAHRAPGFSNHAIGSDELRLAVALDADGDGILDLALPDAARRAMRIVTFAAGRFRELARIAHAAPIASAVLAADLDGDARPEIVYALADGTLAVLKVAR